MANEVIQLGYGFESSPGVDAIDSNSADYYSFGDMSQSFKLPSKEVQYTPIYTNAPVPSATRVAKAIDTAVINYIPYNGLMLKAVLGKSVWNTDLHEVQKSDEGVDKDDITARYELVADTTRYVSLVGAKVQSLTNVFVFHPGTVPMTETVRLIGLNTFHDADSGMGFNGAHLTGPTIPGQQGGGGSNADKYRKNTLMTLTYDAEDYKAHVHSASITFINLQTEYSILNQDEIGFIFPGDMQFLVGLNTWRGADKSIYDNQLSKTAVNVTLKIFQSSTNYREYTITNLYLEKSEAEVKVPRPANDPSVFTETFIGIAEDIQVDVKDGVLRTLYGDA